MLCVIRVSGVCRFVALFFVFFGVVCWICVRLSCFGVLLVLLLVVVVGFRVFCCLFFVVGGRFCLFFLYVRVFAFFAGGRFFVCAVLFCSLLCDV